MRRTIIVCTIGPASESIDKLVQLIEAGMNVARLNFSHGDHEEHGNRIKNIREAEKITGKSVAILLDTKGPEIRTHNMENGAVELSWRNNCYFHGRSPRYKRKIFRLLPGPYQ